MKAYGKLVLELGLLFKNLTETISTPHRSRMLRIMKLMMAFFKAKSNNSKYADELLRFLILQQTLLPPKQALEVFHSLFVNIHGTPNSHIAADLSMEYIVNTEKRHMKHMGSNKIQQSIIKMSKSLAGISTVGKHFDAISSVIRRSSSNKKTSAEADELLIIEGLRSTKPFQMCESEQPTWVKKLPLGSLLSHMSSSKFHAWLWKRGQILLRKLDT